MAEQVGDLGALFEMVLSSRRGQEMAIRLQHSIELTDAFWDLVPIVISASERHHQRSPVEVADSSSAAALVGAERRLELRLLAEQYREVTARSFAAQPFDESVFSGLSSADLLADPFGIINQAMDTPAYVAQVLQSLERDLRPQLLGLSADEGAYLQAYLQALESQPQTPAVLRALFTAVVGAVEPLVSRMASILLYDGSPENYSTMVDPQLDKDARALCYGAPAKWRMALVDNLGVSSLADTVDWDGLFLLWEGRNVVAHRNGLADARYCQLANVRVGSLVGSESEAVQAAIDQIGAARFAIVAGVWDHLTPGMGTVIAQSTGIPTTASLRVGRWRQALGLARVAKVFAADDDDLATAKVNGWLALEQGHGPEAIAAKVQAWDVGVLPPKYAVARYLLLRQDELALPLLGRLVSEGVIDRASLASWPLFDRVRAIGLLDGLMG